MREAPLAHPGEILALDWLEPIGVSQYALAKAIGVPPRRINEIVHGKRSITPDTALRLAAFFGTDAQSWLNLQAHYDLETMRDKIADDLQKIEPHKRGGTIPHDVVRRLVDGATPARAWREHLGRAQADVAALSGISVSDYAKVEALDELSPEHREMIAGALGIAPDLLDF
ncbi:HigA family addiction module antitoxin [Paludibacterium paludis]|uniref:HTH cro/C1-type domain-containing protein n=1 Tax=Paludibacterium paludis TaxID=1225769 RepID=A0A918P6Y3_9NEIS|nr:HigA family addiction module antitoxin [Paludibacterium paludis]GGY28381.1 hypothetical protein GCM10011289_34540 [Paludibacterium paludis]